MIRWLRVLSIQNHGKNFEFKNDLGNANMCVESADIYVVSFILLFEKTLYLTGLRPCLVGRNHICACSV